MANYNATLQTLATNTPPARAQTNVLHGRIRYFESTFTVPAGGLAIADTITWGAIPVGARIIGHLGQLNFAAGTASSTINLGDAASAARHLAATSVAAAGTAVPQAATANGIAGFVVSDQSVNATNNSTLISTVAGAALAAGQVITLRLPYVMD
ncbi:hypothetical protein [Xanthomonas sacchari]|uniref:hypothetical protein n=1 Tax=Xanthomonas sacchari TaxID=56458 RepID=UPI0022566502|nr:hypothetical protein [Xanthomonas sacchari]MCW0370264.1 hypothetical protein [Xanthomonas sacchari]